MRNPICICLLLVSASAYTQSNISTKEDREALFNYIIEKTLIREAWSPVKEETLGVDPRKAMLAVKDEITNASNDTELYYALQKLSSVRSDRHLSISPLQDGLQLPKLEAGVAPIRFHPDYSQDQITIFVSDIGKSLNNVSIGDQLVSINGNSVSEYLELIRPYTRHSNEKNLWRRFAYSLSERNTGLPPQLFKDMLQLTLMNSQEEKYQINLAYEEEVDWQYGRVLNNYRGYKEVADFNNWETFKIFQPTDSRDKTLLLWWYGFRGDLHESIDALIDWAKKNNKLDHDIIIDAIDSRGGSQGAYALARLSPLPFKTTGGNMKLSDITSEFIVDYNTRYSARRATMDGSGREAEDDGSWLIDWLNGPVTKGLEAGQEYSNNVPFKCAHLPHYSDWVMQPATKHFTGNLAILLGPWGGSHLSQFAAMIIDNKLGYSIGMEDGGYSNTWEWSEELVFPISGKPVVEFMWNIGHTIRPNGQILEGNPAKVDEYIPVTKDNYLDYKNILINRAKTWLDKQGKIDKVSVPLRK